MKELLVEQLIKQALIEDMPSGDVTTDYLITDNNVSKGYFVAKQKGVIAGIKYLKQVFLYIDPSIQFIEHFQDGTNINKGDIILEIEGKTKSILKGERLALNIMQRMSGVATLTRQFVERVKGTDAKIVDTRKTTPNFRIFEKDAVLLGGGYNHRFSLSDAVMIKDNHIEAKGGIKEAVTSLRKKISHTTKIEVEVENLEMLKEALAVKADIIMLDNMSTDLMIEAVNINQHQAILEASGNMTLDRVEEVAKCGVDIISVGALTHSYSALDISLRFKI
ncbi:carboxylating nicotinate-nucleotide diphosphorylase [Mycoplasmatota bacterium]|nr:carboxylating nicotinate-nucleotide diphosphorylase [Mycoplasmatota bacterium]